MEKPPIFAVENLTIERDAPILRDLSWRVDAGQHWVILGANGSGKTSLLNAVTGYLMPTSGTVQLGRNLYGETDWREVRRSIGLVSASLGAQIEPTQTGHDIVLSGIDGQINFWRRERVTSEELSDVAATLEHVDATHLAERPWRVLSQGERQRILIGRALMGKFRLLFLDEPCAGLDPVAREDFLSFVEKLARKRQAPTLVLVTHHVEEIVPAISHVLLIREGQVQAAGPRAQVLTSAHLSATFGAPVTLRRSGERYRLVIEKTTGSFKR